VTDSNKDISNDDALVDGVGYTEPPTAAIPKERPGPKGGRRDTNRRERVRSLLEAAEALFLKQGIESTTIDDITKAAGVAKGSFYRYFDGKEALVAHMFGPFSQSIGDILRACGDELEAAQRQEDLNAAYETMAGELGAIFLTQMNLVRLYLQEARAPATKARAPIKDLLHLVTQQCLDLTAKAHTHGILRPFPAALSSLAVMGAVERLLLAVVQEEEIGEPLEAPAALISLVLDGLKRREGETPLFP